MPTCLLELVGPNFFISGAVLGKDNIYLDRLAPGLWLVPQHDADMIVIARVLGSLRILFDDLQEYYCDCSKNGPEVQRFPFFQTFEFQGTERALQYTDEIIMHVFSATVQGLGEVIVKFCEKYCLDAHCKLEAKGYAPKLYYYGRVTPRYIVVVMEKVEGERIDSYLEQNSFKEEVLGHCESALEVLHSQELCHGDLRIPNMLVRADRKICLLDYEWAGIAGEATYPLMMNHVDIEWPDGAVAGGYIQKEHDFYWLQKLRYPLTQIAK